MKIQSIKTKLIQTVDADGWEKIKGRGDARKYIVLSNAPVEKAKAPEETDKADYGQVLKTANAAFKKKDYIKAKTLYLQANSIKVTDLVAEKLAQIETFLDLDE